MEVRMAKAIFLAAASAMLVPAAAGAQVPIAQSFIPLAGTRLDIQAEGEVTRAPDIAAINAGVITQSPTAAAATSQNATRMAAVVKALRAAGVADRDIQTGSISLQPQYRYAEGVAPKITGYQASNRVTVKFRDIAKAGPILDTLVAQGANQIDGPNFLIDKADEALDAARTQAIVKARARAELYARAAGLSVKRILSISESGAGAPPPPMPVMMMREAKAQAADTMIVPGEQKLTISVSVSFELG
jgi:uncharacterized protein YggE